jgi:hypothetical protein
MDSRSLRRNFIAGLLTGLRVVWPILSVLLGLIVALGLVIGLIEGWSVHESIYFAFVSGLTIGYGDLAPKSLLTRALAILIGVCGVLVTALVAAIAVRALTAALGTARDERWPYREPLSVCRWQFPSSCLTLLCWRLCKWEGRSGPTGGHLPS